jgi:hypothetical protein
MQIVYEKPTKSVHVILSMDEVIDLQSYLFIFAPQMSKDHQLPAEMHRRFARLIKWYLGLPENTPKQKMLFS